MTHQPSAAEATKRQSSYRQVSWGRTAAMHLSQPTPITSKTSVESFIASLTPIFLIILVRLAPFGLSNFSYILVALYSLFGRRQAMVSFALLCLITTMTPAAGPAPSYAAILRHLSALTCSFSALLLHPPILKDAMQRQYFWVTTGLSVLLIAHSITLSFMPVLSLLKTLLFSITYISMLSAWGSLSATQRRLTFYQITTIFGLAAITGLALAVAGRANMGPLYRGAFYHPQTAGVLMAIVATWAWISYAQRPRQSPVLLVTAITSTANVILSQARVGGLSLLAGLFGGLLVQPAVNALTRSPRNPFNSLRLKRYRLAAILLTSISVALLAGVPLGGKINRWLTKYGNTNQNVTVNSIVKSRQGLINRMLINIERFPTTGIGFGVPSSYQNKSIIATDPIFGLPVAAKIEKGVLPIAVIEELGIPLGMVILSWLLIAVVIASRSSPVACGLVFATLGSNLAEYSLFATGGPGLFVMLMHAFSVSDSAPKQPEKSSVLIRR